MSGAARWAAVRSRCACLSPSTRLPEIEGDLGTVLALARPEAGHGDPEQPDLHLEREHAPHHHVVGAERAGEEPPDVGEEALSGFSR